MTRNRISPMHGALIRTDGTAPSLLARTAMGAEQYIRDHGLPVPRSSMKKPRDEYLVFLPNEKGYENAATHYAMKYPRSFLIMDGNRFVIRTHNYSDLSAITGVLNIGKESRLTKKVAADKSVKTKTLEDYFADGVDVIKYSDTKRDDLIITNELQM